MEGREGRHPDIMTRLEVAEYLQVSASRLAQGWGPPSMPAYKRPVMYHRKVVEEWLTGTAPHIGPKVLEVISTWDAGRWVPEDGWVYFVQPEGINRVKIGHSTEPQRRIKQLSTGSPAPLVLLDLWRGSAGLEQLLHLALADGRVHREWFSCYADISRLLATQRAAAFRAPESPYGR